MFPNLQIYIPKKGQQKVPGFGTGNEEVQGVREGLSPLSYWVRLLY